MTGKSDQGSESPRVRDTVYGSLGEVSDAQWQAVADRFDLGRVRRAEPLTEGLFGKNVELESDWGLWVFRGRHRDEVFYRERFFAERIAQAGKVGAPWPYWVDDSHDIFEWTYAVMRHVGGEVVSWDDDRDWRAVASALGRAASGLHAVAFPSPAEWRADSLLVFEGSQHEWFRHRISRLVRDIDDHEPLDDDSRGWLAGILDEAGIDGYQSSLVHRDLTIGNARFSFVRDAVEVSGVFDLQGCQVADPDEDLARSLWQFAIRSQTAARTFLEAYREHRGSRPGERERLLAYVVGDLLVFWAFGRRHGHSWFGDHVTFRSWASAITDSVDELLTYI